MEKLFKLTHPYSCWDNIENPQREIVKTIQGYCFLGNKRMLMKFTDCANIEYNPETITAPDLCKLLCDHVKKLNNKE